MTLLQARGLTVKFGGVHALDDVSFEVEAGEIFSVIGPNGAGKTTLFNVLTGIYAPSRGEIIFAGRDLNGMATHHRAGLGIQRTFQNLQTFQSMSVLENVMVGSHLCHCTGFGAAIAGLTRVRLETAQSAREAMHWLELFGLADVRDRPAGTLPYGRQKRLEIARALSARPRLLLLDEPAAGLNAAERIEIAALIRRIAADYATVLLVEHDMKLVMGISHRVLVLNFGRLLANGTPNEIAANPAVIEAYLGLPAELEMDHAAGS